MLLKHDFPFNPTYGYDLKKLLSLQPPAAPDDFEAFWRDTYRQSREIPLRLSSRAVASPSADLEMFEVEYDSLGGARIGAWLTRPRNGRVSRGMVVGHGYGGRDAADLVLPGPPAAAIFPCARGFHRSADAKWPGAANTHVVHGIESRETYIHRGCVADYWAAASALLELVPEVADQLDYSGASFGGGIGALMLPWDNRFRKAFLGVPSFSNHPLRLRAPCVGSGEAVRQYYQAHPEATQVLRYFDAAIAARYIKIPVMVGAALFDPAVPPQGQFSVYNALSGPKSLFVHEAAHFSFPGEAAEAQKMQQAQCKWFSDC
jgi:cephalosporin-C deacetylase